MKTFSFLVCLATASAMFNFTSDFAGCKAVTRANCGTDFTNNCLKCGTASDYDCEECCPGCTKESKSGGISYCTCSGPKPGPAPGPGPAPSKGDYICYMKQCYEKPGSGTMSKAACDKECGGGGPPAPTPHGNWENYKVDGMDVLSVSPAGSIEKVVVMLHGGGGSGSNWRDNFNNGWFGDNSGIKYVFPTSPDSLWYGSTKQAGCGLCDECAYTKGSIAEKADLVYAVIQHELNATNVGSMKKVYLGGFSQGGQMTAYMQIAKLDAALGGVIVMDGYPLPPVCDAHTVKSKATYSGNDMNWFIYWGGADPIFPATESLKAFHDSFDALGVSSAIKQEHTEPGMSHTLIEKEFVAMVKFIRGE